MKLPNGHAATVSDGKLAGYCLNITHDPGKNKARVFKAALGMTADDAEELKIALLAAAATNDATLGRKDAFGERYEVRLPKSAVKPPPSGVRIKGVRRQPRSSKAVEHMFALLACSLYYYGVSVV